MNPQWAAPPAADPCLSRQYSSRPKQKGGTLVDETVLDLGTHLRLLLTPHSYLPKVCRCGCDRLHVHEMRERHPRQLVFAGAPVAVVAILVFICAECRATWRVLPAFLARCLWRTWDVVEREMLSLPRAAGAPSVPARTVARWRSRLAQSARLPVQVLAVLGGALRDLAMRAGLEASRQELLVAFRGSFAELAVLLHRLAPGVRLI